MKLLLFILAFMSSIQLVAQQCDCFTMFDFTQKKIKANYIGFKEKTALFSNYTATTDSFSLLSKKIADEFDCFTLIHNWLGLFKDRHVAISINEDSLAARNLAIFFKNVEKQGFSYIKKGWPKSGKPDRIEGRYKDEAGTIIEVAKSRQSKDEFIGVVRESVSKFWLNGDVKFRLKKSGKAYRLLYYYSRHHLMFKPHFFYSKDILDFSEFGVWSRIYSEESRISIQNNVSKLKEPKFSILNDSVSVLKIPSSALRYKKNVDSILAANEAVLNGTKNLIIDVRGNTGGSILVFEALTPYIYTDPIITTGASVLSTEDNINNYYAVTNFEGVSDSMRKVSENEANLLRKHMGGIFELWREDTLQLSGVKIFPKKISILVNKACASSTELFILKAKQSKKVILFGDKTCGAVDYSDAVPLKVPCSLFTIRYSSSRSNRYPDKLIDNIGIEPDVRIPNTTTDWVQFVTNYYKAK